MLGVRWCRFTFCMRQWIRVIRATTPNLFRVHSSCPPHLLAPWTNSLAQSDLVTWQAQEQQAAIAELTEKFSQQTESDYFEVGPQLRRQLAGIPT